MRVHARAQLHQGFVAMDTILTTPLATSAARDGAATHQAAWHAETGVVGQKLSTLEHGSRRQQPPHPLPRAVCYLETNVGALAARSIDERCWAIQCAWAFVCRGYRRGSVCDVKVGEAPGDGTPRLHALRSLQPKP
jgi:hypothetical protein